MAFKLSVITFVVSLLIGGVLGALLNWPGLASLVAVCCLVSYLVAGFAVNVWITLAVSIVLLMGSLLVLGKLYEKK